MPTKPSPKSSPKLSTATSAEFPAVFAQLRKILAKHAKGLPVLHDTPTQFAVVTPATAPNKKPMWFAAVILGKSAVSYHLLPLYFNPKLASTISPELLKRKQGKACLNFKRQDAKLFAELDALTATGLQHFRAAGFLDPKPITKDQLNAFLTKSGEDPKKIKAKRDKIVKAANAKRRKTLADKGKSKTQ